MRSNIFFYYLSFLSLGKYFQTFLVTSNMLMYLVGSSQFNSSQCITKKNLTEFSNQDRLGLIKIIYICRTCSLAMYTNTDTL